MNAKLLSVVAILITAATPLEAVECKVGPATVNAPACELKHSDTPRAEFVEWTAEDGISLSVVFAPQKRPQSVKNYFAHWRSSHKCSALVPPASAKQPLKQMTWSGSCANGSKYLMRAVATKIGFVELHAWWRFSASSELGEKIFVNLTQQVRLSQ